MMEGYRSIDTSILQDYNPNVKSGYSGFVGDNKPSDFISRLGWSENEGKSMPDWANHLLNTMRDMYRYVARHENDLSYDNQVLFWKTDGAFKDLLFWICNESTFAPSTYFFLDYVARWLKEDPAGTPLTYMEIRAFLQALQASNGAFTQPLMVLIAKWIAEGELKAKNIQIEPETEPDKK
jgi:hypothetical protein